MISGEMIYAEKWPVSFNYLIDFLRFISNFILMLNVQSWNPWTMSEDVTNTVKISEQT